MSNDIGIYIGEWIEVETKERHDLYDLLRHPDVVKEARICGVEDIEDNEELSPLVNTKEDGTYHLALAATDETGSIKYATGIDGFADLCNGSPILMDGHRPQLYKHYSIRLVLHCIAGHPDVLDWGYKYGVCPDIEE